MRISDWSSDVCSSDLLIVDGQDRDRHARCSSGKRSVARKPTAGSRSVDSFASAPKRLASRSRTLRIPVCVPQPPVRRTDGARLFYTTHVSWSRYSRAAHPPKTKREQGRGGV